MSILSNKKEEKTNSNNIMESDTDNIANTLSEMELTSENKNVLSTDDDDDDDDDEMMDEDDLLKKKDQELRQSSLDHIEKTYGLTRIEDTNQDVLPSDYELTRDLDINTDYIDLIHLKIRSIESLNLNRFVNLESLNLRDNLIESLSDLKTLPESSKIKMKELDFYDNRIKHISKHINDFKNLNVLDLSFNNIKHIKHLELLTDLQELFLVQNKISKIENLETLKKLKNLELGGNKIDSISETMLSLTNLEQLWLGQNKISKFENFNNLKNLKILSIQSNKIESLDGLGDLESLEELYLSHNKLKSLDGLQKLKNLTVLDITSNQVSALENMSHLSNLTDFWCSYNLIGDYNNISEEIGKLPLLETVYFEGNPIQLKDPTMYRRKVKLCFGDNLKKIDALYINNNKMV